jgi:hypothetical protein
MKVPGLTAELSVYRTSNAYRAGSGAAGPPTDDAMVVPQQYAACETRTWCVPPTLWHRDYCCRWDRTVFRSLWYIAGICGPIPWFDDEPDPCIPQW